MKGNCEDAHDRRDECSYHALQKSVTELQAVVDDLGRQLAALVAADEGLDDWEERHKPAGSPPWSLR